MVDWAEVEERERQRQRDLDNLASIGADVSEQDEIDARGSETPNERRAREAAEAEAEAAREAAGPSVNEDFTVGEPQPTAPPPPDTSTADFEEWVESFMAGNTGDSQPAYGTGAFAGGLAGGPDIAGYVDAPPSVFDLARQQEGDRMGRQLDARERSVSRMRTHGVTGEGTRGQRSALDMVRARAEGDLSPAAQAQFERESKMAMAQASGARGLSAAGQQRLMQRGIQDASARAGELAALEQGRAQEQMLATSTTMRGAELNEAKAQAAEDQFKASALNELMAMGLNAEQADRELTGRLEMFESQLNADAQKLREQMRERWARLGLDKDQLAFEHDKLEKEIALRKHEAKMALAGSAISGVAGIAAAAVQK